MFQAVKELRLTSFGSDSHGRIYWCQSLNSEFIDRNSQRRHRLSLIPPLQTY
jgi:hypothetical protein